MRRLRAIEDELDRHEAELADAWHGLAAEASDPDEFARSWQETARTWSFARVNELIDRHNRNFPVESQLPMDPRTRDFIKLNGRSYEREPLDEQWILSRFPADPVAAAPGLTGGSRCQTRFGGNRMDWRSRENDTASPRPAPVSDTAGETYRFRDGYSDCGSTSTTAASPARRIAGAAAERSNAARAASARGRSVLPTS
jgi:hypothetical protein